MVPAWTWQRTLAGGDHAVVDLHRFIGVQRKLTERTCSYEERRDHESDGGAELVSVVVLRRECDSEEFTSEQRCGYVQGSRRERMKTARPINSSTREVAILRVSCPSRGGKGAAQVSG